MQPENIVPSNGKDLTGADVFFSGQYTILFALWLLDFSAISQMMIVVPMVPEICLSKRLNLKCFS